MLLVGNSADGVFCKLPQNLTEGRRDWLTTTLALSSVVFQIIMLLPHLILVVVLVGGWSNPKCDINDLLLAPMDRFCDGLSPLHLYL